MVFPAEISSPSHPSPPSTPDLCFLGSCLHEWHLAEDLVALVSPLHSGFGPEEGTVGSLALGSQLCEVGSRAPGSPSGCLGGPMGAGVSKQGRQWPWLRRAVEEEQSGPALQGPVPRRTGRGLWPS